mmetsp:Transcript_136/g.139  ORF Transcript_136/g.139 Transcript_136/m.139 type:complete len:151 (-) Transcript_136:2748-3200(-)
MMLKECTSSTEKALLVVNFSIKDYMPIIFINKNMSKLLKYEKEDLVGKAANVIMPSIISDTHKKFIDNYLVTWKQRMTHQKNEFFVKDSKGYLEPIYMQTFPNIANSNQMVLILERNKDLNFFDDTENSRSQCFLITCQDYAIKELSSNF